jgi:hypothetical protein
MKILRARGMTLRGTKRLQLMKLGGRRLRPIIREISVLPRSLKLRGERLEPPKLRKLLSKKRS